MIWERSTVTVKYLWQDTNEVREQTLDALVAEGLFAVHKPVEGLYDNNLFTCCLTHVPTGYRIAKFFHSYRARAFAEVLAEYTGLDLWRFSAIEDKPKLTGRAQSLITLEKIFFGALFEDIADIAYGDLPDDGGNEEEMIRGIINTLKTAHD